MEWQSSLVSGGTQQRKTHKCFQVLADRLEKLPREDSKLLLFITQANSITSAYQLLSRAKHYDGITKHFGVLARAGPCAVSVGFSRATGVADAATGVAIVDFYNARNTNKMLHIARSYTFKHVFVVFDEVESGGEGGVRARLDLITQVAQAAPAASLYTMFITATVANLSECLSKIYMKNLATYKDTLIEKILCDKMVANFRAPMDPRYSGPSWLREHAFQELVLPKRNMFPSDAEGKEAFARAYKNEIYREIAAIAPERKKLSLIVTSNRVLEHRAFSDRLLRLGYNVVVELNGLNAKDYNVFYEGKAPPKGEGKAVVKHWQIPYKFFCKQAANNSLATYTCPETGREYDTSLTSSYDLTLSHMLCATLMLGTDQHVAIMQHIENIEKYKLLALFARLSSANMRPKDYPKEPKIALVAGNIASRGISIQNQLIKFTCTSFVFVDSSPVQRGALNAQRFGRACGILGEIYAAPGAQAPLLLATSAIMRDALANEDVLRAGDSGAPPKGDGSLVCLKDYISSAKWAKALRKAQLAVVPPPPAAAAPAAAEKIDDVKVQHDILKLMLQNKRETITIKEIKDAGIPIEQRKRWPLYSLAHRGYMENTEKGSGVWRITSAGLEYAKNITE